MSPIAFYAGNAVVYWSSLVIVFGIAAGFFLSYSLYTAHSGRGSAMFVLLGFALPLGLLCGRLVHYLFNPEQYNGFWSALTDPSCGSYFLPAALLCLLPAALLVRGIGISDSTGELLDAMAPGAVLASALIRLSDVFTTACRSALPVRTKLFQRLPFAERISDSYGSGYHFASYFISALLLLGLLLVSLLFFYRHHGDHMKRPCPRYGHTACITAALFCAEELVIDSTRSDSTVLRFRILQFLNPYVSFISLTQVVAAAVLLLLLLRYARASLAANGRFRGYSMIFVLFALGLVGAGVSEYLVQRFTNRAPLCYLLQSTGALAMCAAVLLMYASCRRERRREE